MTWEDAPKPDRSRRWLIGVAAAAAVVVVAVLAVRAGDDGRGQLTVGPTADAQDAADETSSSPATLRATVLDPMEVTSEQSGDGPLLGDGVALTVVAGQRERLILIDVATGDVRQAQLPRSSRPPPSLGTMFTSGDDLIANHHNAVLRMAGGDGAPVVLAEGRRALPTYADDGSVWVSDGLTSAVASTALLVAPDGTVLDRVRLPAVARPVAGTATGLVVSAPGGVSVVNGDGAKPVGAAGDLVATDGERLAWIDCASAARCLVVLGTVDDPDQTRIPLDPRDVPAGYFGLPTGTYSPDGRWLAFPVYRVEQGAQAGTLERPWITVVDAATGALAYRVQGPFTQAFSTLPLAWSPDSQWLFVASRGGLTTWNASTGQSRELPLVIEPPRALAVLPS